MKVKVHVVASVLALMIAAGCASVDVQGPQSRNTVDYFAVGDASGIRAYVYGNRTVLHFESTPFYVAVRDQTGQWINVEQYGNVWRLEKQLDEFTVHLNTHNVKFTRAPDVTVYGGKGQAVTPAQDGAALQPTSTGSAVLSEPVALLEAATQQLAAIKVMIAAAEKEANVSASELANIREHIDELERELSEHESVTLQVRFPRMEKRFKPDKTTIEALRAAVESAERFVVRGYTDARIAGRMDESIARGRAESAKQYLVANGVGPEKITTEWHAAGDFIAPTISARTRAANRRVEIDVISRQQSTQHHNKAKVNT